ncbi:MAG: glutaredoxin family protein [Nitrosomonas sp.]|nr:MAG: glutaredoxin family protein [Nitrosomonas sp.]
MTQKNKGMSVALEQTPSLTLFGRQDCHLCHDMILALRNLQKQTLFELIIIDIDTQPQLAVQYGEKVPVLVSARTNEEICHYFLDLAALDDYLSKFR